MTRRKTFRTESTASGSPSSKRGITPAGASRTGLLLAVHLTGLFMGALDSGIVSPARTVIQQQLGIAETAGIWMITLYTLLYATSIPLSGKLADRLGRTRMFRVSIALFGGGSLLCALAAWLGGFPLLLAGRAIQALGGGGIMPVATAAVGTAFPKEKRGAALGMVGAVHGIANILGASAGSLILALAGSGGWHWLFLINVPVSLLIVAGSSLLPREALHEAPAGSGERLDLPGTPAERRDRLDLPGTPAGSGERPDLPKAPAERRDRLDLSGSAVLTLMILSLMFSLTHLSFVNLTASLASLQVWPGFVAFAALLAVYIPLERRTADPALPLKLFRRRETAAALVCGLLVGMGLMGAVFVPQFAEVALKMKSGSGGYLVAILGFFAGAAAPLGGRLIDRFGARPLMAAGLTISTASALYLAFVATRFPGLAVLAVGLVGTGLGMGLTMGTPLNYMMLSAVPQAESGTAIAALSLLRSVGTAISPALMIGFLAQAGLAMEANLTAVLPQPSMRLEMPQLDELTALAKEIEQYPALMEQLPPDSLSPDAMMAQAMGGSASADGEGTSSSDTAASASMPQPPPDLLASLKSADATTVAARVESLAAWMFDARVTPDLVSRAQDGVKKAQDGVELGVMGLDMARDARKRELSAPEQKAELQIVLDRIDAEQDLLRRIAAKLAEVREALPAAFSAARADYLTGVRDAAPQLVEAYRQTMFGGFRNMYLTLAALSLCAMGVLSLARRRNATAQG